MEDLKTTVIIIIGTEVLNGYTLDSNSNFLAQHLRDSGIHLQKIITIHDEKEEVNNTLKYVLSSNSPDYILITGGLGPTYDDSTSYFLSYALNREFELNKEAYKMVEKRYNDLVEERKLDKSIITKEREKMAWMPIGTKPLKNIVGTAPGLFIEILNGKKAVKIFAMPGVPSEMKRMFLDEIQPKISSSSIFYNKKILVESAGESLLAPILNDVHQQFPDVYIKSMPNASPQKGSIKIIIQTTSIDFNTAKERVDLAFQELKSKIRVEENES